MRSDLTSVLSNTSGEPSARAACGMINCQAVVAVRSVLARRACAVVIISLVLSRYLTGPMTLSHVPSTKFY